MASGARVPNLPKRKNPEPKNKTTESQFFSCLGDLLAFHGRTAPGRDAILAPGRAPLTYRALLARSKETIRGLRSLGVGRRDRVAVALPDGPDSAVTMTSVAAGAVCVPINPRFTADEWRRYLGELRAAARCISDTPSLKSGSDEHLRAILELLDLKRLTTQVGTRLLEILDEP